MWRTILTAARDFLLHLLVVPCLILSVLCSITWLTAFVVVTGTWITVMAAVTGVIAIVAVLPCFVFAGMYEIEKEREERKKRRRKTEQKRRAARARIIAPDHTAPEGEHD